MNFYAYLMPFTSSFILYYENYKNWAYAISAIASIFTKNFVKIGS
jgi:hypothetical protein